MARKKGGAVRGDAMMPCIRKRGRGVVSWQLNKAGNIFQRLSQWQLSRHHMTYAQLWVTLPLSQRWLSHLP